MKKIKILAIEYLFWLYCLACLTWLAARLVDINLPVHLLLALPALLSLIFHFVPGSMGRVVILQDAETSRLSLKLQLSLGILISLIMAWVMVEVKPLDFFTGAQNTTSILKGIFNPNPEQLVPMLLALVETIYLALLATVLAIPFAYFFIRTISTIFRSIEAIVWAIIFCVWVGIGPFAGMLALWIHSISALIKLYSEQIENIDQGPVEAIKATGASTLQIWRYAVSPQILAPYLAFTIYRWDINVRMATIVGFVGGGGIGLALYQQQQMLAWRNVGLIMWLIALIVWVMDIFSAYIREKLVN
jgi:phosphonate transport system permease protein